MKNCFRFLPVALMASLSLPSFAADTFIPYGWFEARIQIDGGSFTIYETALSHSLPSGWSCTIVDTIATLVNAGASASVRRIDAPKKKSTEGIVRFKYKIKTTKAVGPTVKVQIKATLINNASSSAYSYLLGASASGTGTSNGVSTSSATSGSGGMDEDFGTPKSRTWVSGVTTTTWANEVDGTKSAQFWFASDSLSAAASATSPGGGGNFTVASGDGHASFKFYPAALVLVSSGTIKGTTDAFLPSLNIDIYSSTMTHLEDWAVATDGSGDLEFDFSDFANGTYNLMAYTLGSLRTKYAVSYNSSTGVSGLNMAMRYGDLDGDNYVSATEVSFVQSNIGADIATNQAAWYGLDPLYAYPLMNADFDRDGEITNADYALALPNQGVTGD